MTDLATKKPQTYRTREAVGVFADADALEAAVNDLESSGFDRASISVLGSDSEVRNRVGRLYRNVLEIEDDPRAPRTSFVSSARRLAGETAAVVFPLYIGGLAGLAAVVASGGALALAVGVAIIGSAAGASLGGLLAGAIAEHHAMKIEEQIGQGGLVLWVKLADDDAERRALAVLEKSGARDIHIHKIQREWTEAIDPPRRAER
jgi:hypothetical protein